ncbi:MAG: energy transducer TonB [Proteobacteria bacterium]|nr:energy transducer TonB [Pseudomonadota bacterium]MDA0845239.1 energy transducer TonB [Pseudomonadota bacterium]
MAILARSTHSAQPFRLFFAASIFGHLLLAGVVFAMNGFTNGSPAPKSGETLQQIAVVFETEKQPQIETKTGRPQTEHTPPLASKHAKFVDAPVAVPRVYPTINHASLSAPALLPHATISVLPKPKKLQAITMRAEPPRDRNLEKVTFTPTAPITPPAPIIPPRHHNLAASKTSSPAEAVSHAQQTKGPDNDASLKTHNSANGPAEIKQARYGAQPADTSGPLSKQSLRDWGTKVRDRLAHLSELIDGYGRIKLSLEILPSGHLTNVHIIESSGDTSYDHQVVDNIKKVNIFPALGVNIIDQPVLFPITITKRL